MNPRKNYHWMTRLRVMIGLTTALLMVAGSVVGTRALKQVTNEDPSPATGNASVVGQGVSGMPADEIAWRIVADTADPLEVATPAERALGFTVATDGAIIVNDAGALTQAQLAPGEAAFVPEGAYQQRASLGDAPVGYLRIAIVASGDAQDPGNDTLVFGSDGFAAPSGLRDINLVRAVLDSDGDLDVPQGAAPSLVHVVSGSVSIAEGSAQPTVLDEGEAGIFDAGLSLNGMDRGATVLVGFIGAEVPEMPRFAGSVSVGTYLCPPTVSEETVASGDASQFDDCEAMEAPGDVSLTLTRDDGTAFGVDDAEISGDAANRLVWSPLRFGTYTIAYGDTLPEGVLAYVVTTSDDREIISGDSVTIDRDNPDAAVDIMLLQGGGTGVVTATVYNCPEGMTVETIDVSSCELATEGFELRLEGGSLDTPLTEQDADLNESVFIWTGLDLAAEDAVEGDPGTYYLTEPTLPEGYSSYLVVEPEGLAESGGYITLTGDSPEVNYVIVNFIEGDVEPEELGSIRVTAYLCENAGDAAEDCQANGALALQAINIVAIDAGEDATGLTLVNGLVQGDSYLWPELMTGQFLLVAADLSLGEGFTVDRVEGSNASATDGGWLIDLASGEPDADIAIYAVAAADASADDDLDGLTNDDEASYGTDPLNPDSDEDCTSDGDEITNGTDPLDSADGNSCT